MQCMQKKFFATGKLRYAQENSFRDFMKSYEKLLKNVYKNF